MPELKIAIALRSLREPFKQALHTAARLGATGVEIDARDELKPAEFSSTARRQLRKLLDDLGLKISAVSFLTRRGYDTLEELDRRVIATKAAMDFAYSLG
jgi:sugar phosphate isomerase/epimerase